MGKMLISRRPGSTGKLKNSEPLRVSATGAAEDALATDAKACTWEDFLFHLGPVTPRLALHRADRDLRATGKALLIVDDGVVDQAWIKSFLLTPD